MMVSHNYFTSSIGKKQIMALTGFGLLGFTVTHLAGNLLLFAGADAFNFYAYKLTSNPLIYVAEAGLAGMFLLHITLAVLLKVQNNAARPVTYYIKTRTTRGTTFASMTMPITGLILLVFLILHLINFKFGTYYETTVDGVVMRDLFKTVVDYFSNPLYVTWYVFAMCSLGLHTSHGVHSALQTVGANHPKYTPIFKTVSLAYGAIVAFGFSAVAIFCHFQN
jgi:succinate dehydrogenase / fumarate reductase cytochrome b subunit